MKPRTSKSWYTYILRCSDGTLYCGSTNDVKKRIEAHDAAKGARYTRGRGPVKLVYKKKFGSKSKAMSEEARIKGLTRSEKLGIIERCQ